MHGIEHADGIGDVVAVILARVLNAFTHVGAGGKMHDGLSFFGLEYGGKAGGIAAIEDDKFGFRMHRGAVAVGQVIDGDNAMAALDKKFNGMRTDETRPADDHNV